MRTRLDNEQRERIEMRRRRKSVIERSKSNDSPASNQNPFDQIDQSAD